LGGSKKKQAQSRNLLGKGWDVSDGRIERNALTKRRLDMVRRHIFHPVLIIVVESLLTMKTSEGY